MLPSVKWSSDRHARLRPEWSMRGAWLDTNALSHESSNRNP